MKELIKHAAKLLLFGVMISSALLAIIVLFLALPNIFEWLAGYIGTTTTWILFIFIIGAVITYCVAE